MKFKLCSLIVTLLIFNSCEEKFLTSFNRNRNLVINCFFTHTDTSWVNLSYLMDGFSNDSVKFENNANITITEPDGTIHSLHYSPGWFLSDFGYQLYIENKGYYRLDDTLKYLGGLYKLTVEVPGQTTITAYDSIPASVPVRIQSTGYDQNFNVILRLIFDDPAINHNYYYITASSTVYDHDMLGEPSSHTYKEIPYCPNNFIDAQGSETYIFFSDKTFNGNGQELDIIFNNSGNSYYFTKKENRLVIKPEIEFIDSIAYHIQFASISRNYYTYAITYYNQLNADKDFYADPVYVYSNIEGGKGIFAGFNVSRKSYVFTH